MNTSTNNDRQPETDILLSKFISGEASDAECKQAEEWISATNENQRYAASLQEIWEKAGQLAYPRIKDKEAAWSVFEKRIDDYSSGKVRLMSQSRYAWMSAAAILIIVLGWFVFNNAGNNKQLADTVTMLHISSGNEQRTDTLPDGSVIILQSHSSLSYPSQFTGNKRNIDLSGAGFFTVTPDASKPFKIKVSDLVVTVVGTSFLITSSPDSTTVEVKTGIVEVSNEQRSERLYPNEQLVVSNSGSTWIKQTDTVSKITVAVKPTSIPVKNLPPLTELPVSDRPMHAMIVGDEVPILPLDKWIKGEQVNVYEKGKVYLVDFWALWCGPCIAGMEHLSNLQKKYKKDGLEVMSVTSEDAWGNSFEKVTEFIKTKGDKFDYHFAWLPLSYNSAHTYKAIIYNPWLMKAYDSSTWALPQVFLIDKQGRFAFIGDGYSLTESYLKKVLDETYDPAEERKNYIEKVKVEYNTDRFVSYLQNSQIAEAIQLGNAIVNNPQVNSHALIAITDNLFYKYKGTLNTDLLQLGLAAALKGVAVTDSKSPGHLSVLAKAYSLMNKPREAIQTINKAISLAEGDFRDALVKDLKVYEQQIGNK